MTDSKSGSSWYLDTDTVAEVLKDQMAKRRLELIDVIERLRSLSQVEVVSSDRYYSVRFFTDGVDAYIHAFDNAAVYYTGLATEIALIQRLGTARLAGKPKIPSFNKLICMSSSEGILDTHHTELASHIRILRNSYVHYVNVMLHQVRSDIETHNALSQMYPQVKTEMQNLVPHSEQQQMLDIIEAIKSSEEKDDLVASREIPSQDILPHAETVDFIQSREKAHAQWIREVTNEQEMTERSGYGVERRDALECIHWVSDVLVHLRFLP